MGASINSPNVKALRAVLLTTVLALLAGCAFPSDGGSTVVGSGTVRTEARPIARVGAVEFTNQGDLDIRQGSAESLSVEADDNIIPLIQTTMRDNTLVIATKPGISEVRPSTLRYHLVVQDLHAISISGSGTATVPAFHTSNLDLSLPGSGSIRFDQLQCPSLNLSISGSGQIHLDQLDAQNLSTGVSGSGKIELAGQTHSQSISISGSGQYAGGGLQSSECKIDIAGSGSVQVACAKALTVSISGSGKVLYSGSPQVTSTVSGSGSIEPMGQ